MPDEPLKILEGLLGRTRGAYFEGDICSVLLQSPFVVRAFEFALADLAIDCTAQYNNTDSFAHRFWDLDSRQFIPQEASDIATIDVKSTINDHLFVTTQAQRRRVSAFICVNAGDPTFVDFVPNFFQVEDAVNASELGPEDVGRATVTLHRASRLPVSAFGMLSPCTAPYRMPLRLLPEAISRARAHIRGEAIFQNPWTLVSFPEWNPITVNRTDSLKPTGKGHRSACDAVMDIYQAATYQSSESLELDFVGLQPRLADFKLRLDNGPQRFVQHKQEGRVRGRNSLLTQVPITRSSGGYIWWYFCQIDRFDFLFFQFEFSQLPNPVNRIEFFFVPERLIPDSWYTSDSEHADFEIAELKEYRFHKDEDGEWIGHIKEVLRQNPHPRRAGMRPARVASSESPEEILEPGDHAEGLPVGTLGTSAHGRAVHAQLMTSKQRDFFYGVMNECAESRSGLLVCLSRSSSSGDFGFILYEWSQPDQDMWRRYQRPPQFMHTLPPAVEMILITYYTRHEECSYQGPPVTAAEFCRINASKDNRLLIWDIGGADTTMLALIPSNDIRPTEAQREKFRSNFGLSAEEWKASTPVLSSLLCTGLQAGEYTISGDLFSCGCSWDRVWRALHKFAAEDVVEHPPRRLRQAPDFRYTVTHVLSRLVCEHHLRSRLEERVPDTEADAEGED